MKTIVLDFTDGKIKILNHKPMQIEKMEELLLENYNLSQDSIEWMTVDKLEIEYLN